MAGISAIDLATVVASMLDDYLMTHGRLRRHALTAALAAEFAAIRPEIEAAQAEEWTLVAARYEATAAAFFLDEELNAIVDGVSYTLLIDFDRESPQYREFFHNQRPSELKKPILGTQLSVMTKWPEALEKYSNEALKKYGVRLATTLPAAQAAATEVETTETALSNFRTMGTRAKLIQKYNALRKATYGKLGEIQHAHKLETGWAESFFRSGSSGERVTLSVLDRRIAAVEATLASLTKQRQELAEREESVAKAKADAERAAKKARLEGLRKAKAELEAEAAKLETELGD